MVVELRRLVSCTHSVASFLHPQCKELISVTLVSAPFPPGNVMCWCLIWCWCPETFTRQDTAAPQCSSPGAAVVNSSSSDQTTCTRTTTGAATTAGVQEEVSSLLCWHVMLFQSLCWWLGGLLASCKSYSAKVHSLIDRPPTVIVLICISVMCSHVSQMLCDVTLHRLRNKKDEEDSDAEDEELPLTADEQAEQQVELDKHAAACDKVSVNALLIASVADGILSIHSARCCCRWMHHVTSCSTRALSLPYLLLLLLYFYV